MARTPSSFATALSVPSPCARLARRTSGDMLSRKNALGAMMKGSLDAKSIPALGQARADQVTKTDLVALLNAIQDRGAPVQANRTLALLRKMFNWAVAEGYLQASPATGIPTRANEEPRTRTLTPNELAASGRRWK